MRVPALALSKAHLNDRPWVTLVGLLRSHDEVIHFTHEGGLEHDCSAAIHFFDAANPDELAQPRISLINARRPASLSGLGDRP